MDCECPGAEQVTEERLCPQRQAGWCPPGPACSSLPQKNLAWVLRALRKTRQNWAICRAAGESLAGPATGDTGVRGGGEGEMTLLSFNHGREC